MQVALEQEMFDVHRSLNALVPVNMLPVELIVDILLRVYEAAFTDPDLPGTMSGWLYVPSVCLHWREVVFSTPAFWRYIKVGDSLEWLAFSLSCAANGPVEIYFQEHANPSWIYLDGFIRPHLSSIRLLSHTDVGIVSLAHLDSFLASPMPVLVTLRMECQDEDPKKTVSIPRHQMPLLTSLTLKGFNLVKANVSTFTHLHHLQLDTCAWPIGLTELLSVLAQSSNLATLILRRCLPEELDDSLDPNSQPVALPSLRTLEVKDHSLFTTATALNHLYVPKVTTFSLGGILDAEYEDEITETITGMLPVVPATVFPVLKTVSSVEMTIFGADFRLRLRDVASTARIDFEIRSRGIKTWEDSSSVLFGLSDILAVCAGASITTLRLRANWATVYSESWQEVFAVMPALEEIELSGYGWASDVYLGLGLACEAAPVGECCPALRAISLDGLDGFRSKECEQAMGALRVRTERGHAQLETLKLHLEFFTTEEFEECYGAYFDQLAMLARDVSFTHTLREPAGFQDP
ncbi:hypothetical protein TRAPUB_5323 [Trametes pubescens]|uniref:F-box domain-containing protein n=1 Tax=Trametes pubescens TaxID=154538 RepID=A0A1M2V8U0_TRAPU|nr:hypothetical protein TRAPUB_5323 [Trametes pubescens]